MKKSYDEASGLFTFSFTGLDPITFRLSDFPEKLHSQFTTHGVLQKVGDSATGPAGTTEAERRQSVAEMVQQLKSGIFNAKRGVEVISEDDLLAAVMAASNRSEKDCRKVLEDSKKREAALSLPEVKLQIQKLKLARREAAAKSEGSIGSLFA